MVIAKVIKVSGESELKINETAILLQDFLNAADPADVNKLLFKVKQKPSLLKTALKFV